MCKCEGVEGAGQVTVSAHKHDVHRSWGNNWKSLPAWITFHMLYKGQCVICAGVGLDKVTGHLILLLFLLKNSVLGCV